MLREDDGNCHSYRTGVACGLPPSGANRRERQGDLCVCVCTNCCSQSLCCCMGSVSALEQYGVCRATPTESAAQVLEIRSTIFGLCLRKHPQRKWRRSDFPKLPKGAWHPAMPTYRHGSTTPPDFTQRGGSGAKTLQVYVVALPASLSSICLGYYSETETEFIPPCRGFGGLHSLLPHGSAAAAGLGAGLRLFGDPGGLQVRRNKMKNG